MTSVHKLGWYGLPRQAIPGVMLGMEQVRRHPHGSPEDALTGDAEIAVAFHLEEPENSRTPRLAVIPDALVAELLSWVHTFSSETFPLSQYCRILSQSDWKKFSNQSDGHWTLQRRQLWSSLVAGEMLGQAEITGPVSSTPLGWAHGCLSYALARTYVAYDPTQMGPPDVVATRLSECEKDKVFQRKRTSTSTLSSVWSFAEQQHASPDAPAKAVLDLVSIASPQMGHSLRANVGLKSSSAELRVRGFDAAVDEAMGLRNLRSEQRQGIGPMLAGAAFLVGSGTSHISLIAPYALECPEAYAWFGLMAGIAGPQTWDPEWMRLVKGVERLLSANHCLTDAPQADLSWLEYDWLSKLSANPQDAYTVLPKQNPRSLTVELVPGVACQFRFSGGKNPPNDARSEEIASARIPAGLPAPLTSSPEVSAERLTRASELAKELQSLLSSLSAGAPAQRALFVGSAPPPAPEKKRSYVKRSPRNT